MHSNLGASERAAGNLTEIEKEVAKWKNYTHRESDTVKTWRVAVAVAGLETSYNVITDLRADKQDP